MKQVSLLIKPASSLCSLRCRFCFYEDEAASRAQRSMGVMSPGTVRALLEETFRAVEPGGAVGFTFQGGEPTLAGLDFFRGFVRQARALCPPGVPVDFSLQTNGLLLDESWANFLQEERFLVGLSVDGFKDLHNLHRVDAQGGGTWNRVLRALALLQKHRVEVNALCVVTGLCARSPDRAYRQLKKLDVQSIQFIPCLDPLGAERGSLPFSLTPEAYGKFLCRVFDLWYQDWAAGQYRSVRLFDDYIRILLGEGASTCAVCGRCGSYLVVEADGSVYPCDFFALDQWRMGRVGEQSLTELARSDRAQAFLDWGKTGPAECAACRWASLCGGGCKRDWYGEPPRNYYCAAFQSLLDYAMPRLVQMARAVY